MAKKILSVLLAAAMLLTVAPMSAFASNKPQFNFVVGDAVVGETVTVTLSAVDMIGTESAGLTFLYDSEYLEYVSVKRAYDGFDLATGGSPEVGEVTFAFVYLNSARVDSDICTITFKVLKAGTSAVYATCKSWDGTEMPEDTSIEIGTHTHDYVGIVTAPTCEDSGYTTYSCSCGDYYEKDYTDILGHTYSNGGLNCDVCGQYAFYYEINDGEVEITEGVWGLTGDIIIPDEIEGFPVTEIGRGAFACLNISSIVIPESVESIGYGAFYLCEYLTNIDVDENNEYYSTDEYGVLFNKDKTLLIQYPAGSELTAYTIPDGVIIIGEPLEEAVTSAARGGGPAGGAFSFSSNLTQVVIPDSATTIADGTFAYCDALTDVIIGIGVTSIGADAFYSCSALEQLIIPDSVTSIGYYAFDSEYLKDICYTGSEEDWNSISIDGYFEDGYYDWLGDINIHYDYCVHNYVPAAITATCTEKGYTAYTCSSCGDSYVADYVDAAGHTEEVVAGHAATCTETGFTDGVKCAVCGIVIVEQNEIRALGHTEEIIAEKASTCTEAGLTEGKKCTVCGVITVEQTEIPALGHTEEAVAGKTATCTEKGLTEGKKCTVCGAITVEQTEIAALGHTEEAVAGYDSTYTETGLTDGKKCSVCGEILVAQEEIPMKVNPNLEFNADSGLAVNENGAMLNPEMKASDVLNSSENGNIQILNAGGEELGENDYVGTGCVVQVLDADGNVLSTYDVIVESDVDGNGKISAADARLALRNSAKLENLEGVYSIAANADGNEKITASDARLILRKSAKLE